MKKKSGNVNFTPKSKIIERPEPVKKTPFIDQKMVPELEEASQNIFELQKETKFAEIGDTKMMGKKKMSKEKSPPSKKSQQVAKSYKAPVNSNSHLINKKTPIQQQQKVQSKTNLIVKPQNNTNMMMQKQQSSIPSKIASNNNTNISNNNTSNQPTLTFKNQRNSNNNNNNINNINNQTGGSENTIQNTNFGQFINNNSNNIDMHQNMINNSHISNSNYSSEDLETIQGPNQMWNNPQTAYQCNSNLSEQFKDLQAHVKQKAINVIPIGKLQNTGKILGEGGFGSVYEGIWMNTKVAIKEMLLSYSEFKTMDQEMQFMATNRHPKLVQMYGISITELRVNKIQCCIVMEQMHQDLESYIFDNPTIYQNKPLKQKVLILRDLAEGIDFLHQQEIVHRDIKPKNLLLDLNTTVAKITDLGIAKALEDKEKTLNATIAYTARYVSKDSAVDEITSFASDMWSLGLVMYETLTGLRSWNNVSNNKIIINLAKEMTPFQENWESIINSNKANSNVNSELIQIVKSCINYEPQQRPKAVQVYNQLNIILQKL